MKINKFSRNNYIYYIILLFSLFPITPNKVKGLPVILLLIFGIKYIQIKKIQWKSFFVNSSLYLVFLSTLFFNPKLGVETKSILETSLSILVIPLIFFVFLPSIKFSKKLLNSFMRLFVVSTTLFITIISIYIFIDNETFYYSNWYTNKARTLIEKFPIIGQHPIYASIFSSISIFFILEFIRAKDHKIFVNKGVLISLLFLNFLFLLLILSKGVVISLFISICFYIYSVFKKKKIKYILIGLFSILLVTLFMFNRRMGELLKYETYTEVNTNYSNGIRLQVYKCAYELIKENIFFGYGIGNTQDILNDCYLENKKSIMLDKYNSHNQYLDIILKSGIIGCIVFLYFLLFNFSKATKIKNELLITVLLFYSIIFLTENILLRQSGVILFYFLIAFMNKFNLNNELKNDGRPRVK